MADLPDDRFHMDLPHEFEHVRTQIAPSGGPAMGGFAQVAFDFLDPAQEPAAAAFRATQAMRYFAAGPSSDWYALHALAGIYTICDRSFASLPGPTWPNRFFALTGTTEGHVDMPATPYAQRQDTIFDCLNDAGVSWRVFRHDIPQSIMLRHQWTNLRNLARYRHIEAFYDACQQDVSRFPGFSFIEPNYGLIGHAANDAHPPHGVDLCQELIADVYNALRQNDRLFQSTLLIVTCDEHGGFYDHVEPPRDERLIPDGYVDQRFGFRFDQLGVRVPTVLVSPYAPQGVCHHAFDHTSVLRYLLDKCGVDPARLGQRVANQGRPGNPIGSIAVALSSQPRPLDDLPLLVKRRRDGVGAAAPDAPFHDGQEALIAMSLSLPVEGLESPEVIQGRLAGASPEQRAAAGVARIDTMLARARAAHPEA